LSDNFMTLLHPWAVVLGVAAATLPVVIHWLTRPRPRRLPLSTIRFVREAVQQRRARNRLKDWIVLSLRTLAVFFLAWAIARPLLGARSAAAAGESSDADRIVLLDVSHSMAAEANGIQLFERARPLAASFLNDQVGLQANLILAGATARPAFTRLSTNFAALREELAGAKTRPERLNVQAAINLAAESFAGAGSAGARTPEVAPPARRRRELIVISDFQRSNWAAVDFSVLPEDTEIQLNSVAPPEGLPNLAVLRVTAQGRAEAGRDVRVAVEVGNFSPTPRQVQVELVLGATNYRLEGFCPAGDKTILSTEVTPPGSGWQLGEARLLDVQDALPADNVRPFVLEVRPAPLCTLLTRQPAGLRPSSSYYLERALAPHAGTRSGDQAPARSGEARVVRLDPARLDRKSLTATEIAVLDHPGKLATEAVPRLATFLRRGRGVLYVAAEPADAGNLKLLAEAAGSELQMPVEFMPAPAGQRRRDLFIAEVRRDQAPFEVFGDSLSGLLATLRFSGGLASRRVAGGLADDVLATYSDRSACLVVSSCGEGTLAILNADLSASNLPASPAFVPLIGELTGRLLGRRRGVEIACGEPVAVYLPPTAAPATGLRLVGPGREREPDNPFVEEGESVLWRAAAAGPPGVYQVVREDRTLFAVAAAVPPEESDLRPLDPSVFQGRLAGGRTVHFRAASGDEDGQDSLWIWLAVGCIACLLGELAALRMFRT
jgi:hypothetical protein